MSNTAAEPKTEEVQEQEVFTFELPEEEKSAVKATVIATHKGKAEDELTAEIATAEAARIEELKTEYAPIFAKAAELKALPENAEKTEDELVALAQEALAVANPNGDDANYDINNDPEFMGRAAKGVASTDATAGTPAATAVELPAEVKEKIAKYEKYESDPMLAAYLSAKESGAIQENFFAYANKELGVNPSEVTNPAWFKERELIEMQKADPALTQEDLMAEMEEFIELGKTTGGRIKQWESVKSLKERMKSEYDVKVEKFAVKVAEQVNSSQQSFVQTVREAESELKTYEGQKYRGANVSKAQTDKVLNLIRSGVVPFKKADGTADVSKSVEALLDLELLPEMRQAAYERGKRDAKAKFDSIRGKSLLLKAKSSAPSTRTPNREESLKRAQEKAGMV